MLYLVVKALLSGVIAMAVSEIGRRSPAFGALVASLPLVSLLAIIWLWRDTRDTARIAAHAQSHLLGCHSLAADVPGLSLDAAPWRGLWIAIGAVCLLTAALYGRTVPVAARFGVRM
jgi:hypothetical protein